MDALEQALEGPPPAFLYTIPTFQNPTGSTLSEDRRRRLAELVRSRRFALLEDDPYGLVRFEGDALPSLFELEGGVDVMYSSSVSKTVTQIRSPSIPQVPVTSSHAHAQASDLK